MKLEHLIQGYKFNKIKVIDLAENKKDKSGVLKFTDNIFLTYYKDDEEIITSVVICADPKVSDTINIQLKHTTNLLKAISNTILLLGNTTTPQATKIMTSLGLYNGTFIEGKKLKFNDYNYFVEIINNLFIFKVITNCTIENKLKNKQNRRKTSKKH